MRYRILLIASLVSSTFLFSQDAILSQYNSFPLYTNMAMAGSKGCSRVVIGTRLQWLNLNGGYKTHYFSYDQYSRHLRSGFGIQYCKNDEANGMITNEFLHFSFSPSIPVGKRTDDSLRPIVIKPAFDIGLLKYKFDWTRYIFGDMIDPIYGYIYNSYKNNKEELTAPDFGTGMFIYGKYFFGGIYFQHIAEPEVSVLSWGSSFPAKLTLHGGYLMKGYKWLGDFALARSFIYEQQGLYEPGGGMSRTEITLTSQYKKFSLGITERIGSALVFLAGFEYRFFKIGYSYDLNTNHAGRVLGSTHEIMMGFNFACRKKYKHIRTLDFPLL